MKIIINKEELKREWSLNRWYEKVIYVIGLVMTAAYLAGIVLGIVIGIIGSN